jgi:hypothetical protein
MQGASKRALQLWKLIYIYSEDMYSVFNCHIVAKHTEFYWDSYCSMRLSMLMEDVSKTALQLLRAPPPH